MKKRGLLGIVLTLAILTGCGNNNTSANTESVLENSNISFSDANITANQITELEKGFSSAHFSGDDGFDEFLSQGGASSDKDVVKFLSTKISANMAVSTIGSTVGAILAILVSDQIVSAVLKLEGISNYTASPNLAEILIPPLFVIVVFTAFGYIFSRKVKYSDISILTKE